MSVPTHDEGSSLRNRTYADFDSMHNGNMNHTASHFHRHAYPHAHTHSSFNDNMMQANPYKFAQTSSNFDVKVPLPLYANTGSHMDFTPGGGLPTSRHHLHPYTGSHMNMNGDLRSCYCGMNPASIRTSSHMNMGTGFGNYAGSRMSMPTSYKTAGHLDVDHYHGRMNGSPYTNPKYGF
jgi:hypothetical protein